MLIQFTVGNYLSFKEPVTLSMTATDERAKFEKLNENNVFKIDDELSLLKSAAVYGANASGKSNFVKAMDFMRWFVLNSSKETQVNDLIGVEEFKLSTETEGKPSFFEIVFILDGRIYRYGFELDKKDVVSEWLFHVTKINESKMLFERDRHNIEMTKVFKEGNSIAGKTRNNALFLSVNSEFNGTISTKILLWFEQKFNVVTKFSVKYLKQSKYRREVLKLINKLGLNIDNIKIAENLQTFRNKYDAKGNAVSEEIFDFEEHESEGTKKLFALAVPIINALKKGGILGIDEFDVRLHPLVTRTIVDLFNSNDTNPHNAQLIIITHDTNLLNKTIFRRDQIWFANKNNKGASNLYSLVDFQVKNDANFENDYLKGRYDAIPFIGNLSGFFSK